MALKRVKKFARKMLAKLLEEELSCLLVSPAATRSATSLVLRPVLAKSDMPQGYWVQVVRRNGWQNFSMSKAFSRRNLFIGAGAAALVGSSTYLLTRTTTFNSGGKFQNPEQIASKGGVLQAEITAAPTVRSVANKNVQMIAYNGSVPGPTLRVRPGDKVQLKIVNKLEQPTNLHTHGLFVSPNGNSDNPFVHVMPGESFDYEYQIPSDHLEGTHWYHPHAHGHVADQVFGGLYGAIIVEDDSTPEVTEDRILVISDASFDFNGRLVAPNMMDLMMGREGELLLVNGDVQPEGETKLNAVERWRIVNACVARYLSLQVVGGEARLLGLDGQKFAESEDFQTRVLAPGNRADVLVNVKSNQVSLIYNTVPHPDAGMMGMQATTYTDYPLVTFKASGTAPIVSAKHSFKPSTDLRNATVNSKRTFTLAMPNHAMAMGAATMEGMFTINGEAFSQDKVNTAVVSDTVEEWTIINNSTMQHPFHLHIWPMQVMSINGQATIGLRYQDVVSVPANGQVIVRINFHTHTGKTLYHCHILDHEDLGMMGVIQST